MPRILVLDSIKEEREEISEILHKEGFEVVATTSGEEALNIFNEDKFELVVIDIQMPEKNGMEVLKKIRKRDPGLCVIIITQYNQIEKAVTALRLGAYDFVERPLRNDDLVNSIKRCLEKRKLERELNEANGLLNAVFSSMGEGVVVIDRGMRIVGANIGFIKRINSKKEDVIGRFCYKVSHHYDRPCNEKGVECPVLKTFRTGEPAKAVHIHFNTHGDPFYVEVNSYPIENEKSEVIHAVECIIDITERVKFEEERKERIKELEEFYSMAVGRELRMKELKEEIERLKEELKKYKPLSTGSG